MKFHPILFNTSMVQSILHLLKRMTRRTKGLKEINVNPDDWQFEWADFSLDKPWRFTQKSTINKKYKSLNQVALKCPYGNPGDILWVKETYAFTIGKHEPYDTYSYKADSFHRDVNREGIEYTDICKEGWYDPDLAKEVKFKSSRFMPKAAARIFLEITKIRVERLQKISEKDAIAEGIEKWYSPLFKEMRYKDYLHLKSEWRYPFSSFHSLWTKINGPDSWKANPWVWVIEFKRIEKPANF